MAQPPSQRTPYVAGDQPLGTQSGGSPFTTEPGADPFHNPPVTIEGLAPSVSRPRSTPPVIAHDAPLYSDAADPHAIPADLNGAWRGLMWALGVHLPNGLNRAVAAGGRLHRAVA